IGVLTCFTVADKVEVSTRRLLRDGKLAEPLRLSVSKVEDFFVLRKMPWPPTPMPSRFQEDEDYRQSAGTSIALRINPARTEVSPELIGEQTRNYLMCPPVPVTFNGQPSGRFARDLITTPLIEKPVAIEVEQTDTIRDRFTRHYSVSPVDKTEEALSFIGPL